MDFSVRGSLKNTEIGSKTHPRNFLLRAFATSTVNTQSTGTVWTKSFAVCKCTSFCCKSGNVWPWVDLGSRIISNLQSDQTLLPQQTSHDLSVVGNCLIQLIFFITIYLSHIDHNGEQSNLYSGFSENILLHCNFKIIYSIVSVATYLLRECVVNFSWRVRMIFTEDILTM